MAGLIRGMLKTALLAKVWQFVQRQLAKPENQARAKELFRRVTRRSQVAATPTPGATTRAKGATTPSQGSRIRALPSRGRAAA